MVKQITKVLLNSISALPATRFNRVISSSVCHNGLRYSTSVPDGPASHEDLKSVVEKDIKDNSVMIYMKGLPDMPRCGFSSLAVRVLKVYDVPFSARNILENPELKNAVKSVRLKECIVDIVAASRLHGWMSVINHLQDL
ncbi:monothiol glutaredoxin-S15, mitochondrial-like isoform X2 [Neltuma alba]|uniref:monothiol glutaredoxin-S15, mitochondrial-like isoform X2 n=1 Tax=Neltuma alba TaxID=207710 RepID=UPI0010A535EA|nr:monothiol glutaredoxin-S15, mitochondrial-like isoform X2 [Prosopis alba]XP_028776248.1 monothiol glutaredoxin-S15, mitochondrial-like isoform X2 [Prosopis alba]